MSSISSLKCSTGEDWIAWPVGTPSLATDSATRQFSAQPDVVANVKAAAIRIDDEIGKLGANITGLWVPEIANRAVMGEFWAGVDLTPDASLRTAARYMRSIEERTTTDVTVFSHSTSNFHIDNTEAAVLVETCAKESGHPLVRITVVYFPPGSERPVLKAICPLANFKDLFVIAVAKIAAQFSWCAGTQMETPNV